MTRYKQHVNSRFLLCSALKVFRFELPFLASGRTLGSLCLKSSSNILCLWYISIGAWAVLLDRSSAGKWQKGCHKMETKRYKVNTRLDDLKVCIKGLVTVTQKTRIGYRYRSITCTCYRSCSRVVLTDPNQ